NGPMCLFRAAHLDDKFIPRSPYGGDVLRLGRMIFNLLADACDMNGDGRGVAERIHAPYAFEQFLLAEDAVPVLQQEQQEIEFFRRKADPPAVYKHSPRVLIDDQSAHLQPAVSPLSPHAGESLPHPVIAAEMRFHPGYEFRRTERFCDIVIGSEIEAFDFV